MKGTCDICQEEPKFVRSYLNIIGRNFNNYCVENYQGDPILVQEELWICIDCRKNKEQQIIQKFSELLNKKIK